MVLDCNEIKSSVVNTEMERIILFLDEEYRDTSRRFGVSNESFGQHLINVSFQSNLFRFSESIDGSPGGLGSRQEINTTVI
jgi:hypothetical protein